MPEKTWQEVGINDRRVTGGMRTGNVKINCPRCGSNDRSLWVHVTKKTWKCFRKTCQWTGSLLYSEDYVKPVLEIKPALSERALNWLLERGISIEAIHKHKLYSQYIKEQNLEREKIAFPMYRHKELTNVSFRHYWQNPEPEKKRSRYSSITGAKLHLINIDSVVPETNCLWWVEGWLDGLALETAAPGTPWVSIPNGSPALRDDGSMPDLSGRLEYINYEYEKLRHIKKHILFLDDDEPGKVMIIGLATRLNPSKCYIMNWPTNKWDQEKVKDAGDILQLKNGTSNYGRKQLSEFIHNYEPYPLESVYTRSDIKLALVNASLTKPDAYIGIPELDRLGSVVLGYLTIITGVPNIGKSTLVSDMVRRVTTAQDWKATYFSAEDSLSDITKRLAMQLSGKPYHQLDLAERELWSEFIFNHFHFIQPNEIFTVDALLPKAEELFYQYGDQILVVDPMNKFDESIGTSGLSEVKYLQANLNKFSRHAKKFKQALFLVAHPSMVKDSTGDVRQIRSFYEISGGAQWANIADMICCLNPPDKPGAHSSGYTPARFDSFKVRQRPEYGALGHCKLWFNRENKRFYDESELEEGVEL